MVHLFRFLIRCFSLTGCGRHLRLDLAYMGPLWAMGMRGGIPLGLIQSAGIVLQSLGPRLNNVEADDGSRTRDLKLGKLALYQLSYVRVGT